MTVPLRIAWGMFGDSKEGFETRRFAALLNPQLL
jgi:hypothetical protein